MAAHTCPADGAELGPINVHAKFSKLEVDMCPTCKGVFLDGGELGQLLGETMPRTETSGPKRTADPLACPKCAGPMGVQTLHGVEIDQCTQCASMWLDRGELGEVQERARRAEAEEEAVAASAEEAGLTDLLLAIKE